MVFALDTNAIIHLIHDMPNVCRNFKTTVANGDKIVVPKPVDYEVRRGFYIKPNPRREAYYHALLGCCTAIEINSAIWDYAIPVYATHYNNRHTADEMDILIAAICLQNDFTLVTNNAKDFHAVAGLKWVDWSAN